MKIQEISTLSLSMAQNLVFDWIPGGRMKGSEYVVQNPKRPDSRSGSFSVNCETGVWKDFATGEAGADLIDLYAWLEGLKPGDAMRAVAAQCGQVDTTKIRKTKSKPSEWEISNEFATRELSDFEKSLRLDGGEKITASSVWYYHNSDGDIVGAVCRFDPEGKPKDIRPMQWMKSIKSGRNAWRQKGFPEPRPLYGVHHMEEHVNSIIILVEGEKCAEELQSIIPVEKAVVTCWHGGSQAIAKVNYTPLKGRKVVLWPDNDQTGFDAMNYVASKIHETSFVKIVQPDPQWPEKYDVADLIGDGSTVQDIFAILKGAKEYERTAPDSDEPPIEEPPIDTSDLDDYEPVIDHEEPSQEEKAKIDAPWRALGHDHGSYYYWSSATKQVVELQPSQHVEGNLLMFAPLAWYGQNFPIKTGVDWATVRNLMMAQAHQVGVYDPENLRGIGCWSDGDHIVVHAGQYLKIGNERVPLHAWKSKYIYEAGVSNNEADVAPATVKQANFLLSVMQEFTWTNPIHAHYMAGWVMTSIVGGASPWRPHAFLTGGAGTGKSTLLNQVVKKILGTSCCYFKGKTTEAGFRQYVGSKSLPIIWDEVEAESSREHAQLDSILASLRTASSESDAKIYKGGKDGTAMSFAMHSCAIMAGINVNLEKRADVTRFTIMTLTKDKSLSEQERVERFKELSGIIVNTLTPEFCASIRARAISLAHVIRANQVTFAHACAEQMGARLGDQIGALLAGAFALSSNKEISLDAARKWVSERDFSEHDDAKNQEDDADLVDHLLSCTVITDNGKRRSIAELINIINKNVSEYEFDSGDSVTQTEARSVLGRHGLGVTSGKGGLDEGLFVIANKHPALSKLLENTAWERGWKHQVSRIENAIYLKSFAFAGKVTTGYAILTNKLTENSL